MDLPADVQIYNEVLGFKPGRGTLVAVDSNGYYEMILHVKERRHRALLPVEDTVIVFREPEPEFASDIEIER